jgi:hypothetical protein
VRNGGEQHSITFSSLGELIPQKNKSWGIRIKCVKDDGNLFHGGPIEFGGYYIGWGNKSQ